MGEIIRRRDLLALLAAAASAGAAWSQTAPPAASAGPVDPKLLEELVAGNRILADQGVVDGFGHVSARHDKQPDRFLLARSMAPGLVRLEDIMEFDLDGAPVDARGRSPYLERFIHSEIYRARPDVGSVAHSHAASVIPFGVTKAQLKPIFHMASFLGAGAPVFEIRDVAGQDSDMLIRSPELGRALAAKLGKSSVALLRGHGFVAVGATVKTCVMHAIYTPTNAQAQGEAMRLGQVTYLNPAEAAKISAINDGLVDKNWDLWKAHALAR